MASHQRSGRKIQVRSLHRGESVLKLSRRLGKRERKCLAREIFSTLWMRFLLSFILYPLVDK